MRKQAVHLFGEFDKQLQLFLHEQYRREKLFLHVSQTVAGSTRHLTVC